MRLTPRANVLQLFCCLYRAKLKGTQGDHPSSKPDSQSKDVVYLNFLNQSIAKASTIVKFDML
jgi:hypothetical protein